MHSRQQTLRSTLGRALREIRLAGRLSLDDVERATTSHGPRVTRSHLSRVETGQADITLSRYLSLLRALGEGAGRTTAHLAALLDEDLLEGAEGSARWRRALASGDLLLATRVLRALHARNQPPLDRATLRTWGEAEAGLGRWHAAAHVLRLALPSSPARRDVLALATAQIGAEQTAVACLLAMGLRQDRLSRLLESVSRLASGRRREALEIAESICEQGEKGLPDDLTALATVVRAESFRRQQRHRAAFTLARRAVELASPASVVRVESLRAAARCAAAAGHCSQGLRWSRQAVTLGRELSLVALRGASLLDERELHLRSANRSEAGAVRRRGRLVLRRCRADTGWDTTLPLHGLLSVCTRRE